MARYVLGGGCFWCLDAVYRRVRGVTRIHNGYAGGHSEAPDYQQVASGTTGHAEVSRISFDPNIIPAAKLLDIFFVMHDPTTPNRQGADEGTQYRSIMLYADREQKAQYEAARDRAQAIYKHPIVTEIAPLGQFYPAEAIHQNYYDTHPEAAYCKVVINPKLIKTRALYAKWFKEE